MFKDEETPEGFHPDEEDYDDGQFDDEALDDDDEYEREWCD